MLYLSNWLTAVLRSITLEHSCVAVYLLIVTLAFLFIPSFWRGKANLHRQQLSEPLVAVKLQRYFNHQTSSPGIVTYCHKPSDRISDLRDYFSKPKRDSRRQSYPEKSIAEFNFTEIRDKFQNMGAVNDFQMPFPDPPPPIQINPVEPDLDKLKDVGELPKGERMFELRRIQHGDRAVSTGETAQQLEEFFTRDQNDTIRAPRSEGVQNELELLTRNRSVGNLLNTRFRTLLENSLRAPPQPTTRSTPSTRTGPLPPPPPPGAPRVPPAPPVPGALPPNESTAARLERETVAAHMSQAALQAAEQYEPPDFANRQFDYAISDVEELFQRRLVSDVLHSTFRNVLELHIEDTDVRRVIDHKTKYADIRHETNGPCTS
ncbi:uncharacterized protein LOC134820180 isoform X3 [Bolinopsis microptera]|uniref:uncharacterized protein LOC134820180 isoform X3 n=1 Tax=Bolinopsis microptera TaxID=2820187 RepID=UPI00307AE6BB